MLSVLLCKAWGKSRQLEDLNTASFAHTEHGIFHFTSKSQILCASVCACMSVTQEVPKGKKIDKPKSKKNKVSKKKEIKPDQHMPAPSTFMFSQHKNITLLIHRTPSHLTSPQSSFHFSPSCPSILPSYPEVEPEDIHLDDLYLCVSFFFLTPFQHTFCPLFILKDWLKLIKVFTSNLRANQRMSRRKVRRSMRKRQAWRRTGKQQPRHLRLEV